MCIRDRVSAVDCLKLSKLTPNAAISEVLRALAAVLAAMLVWLLAMSAVLVAILVVLLAMSAVLVAILVVLAAMLALLAAILVVLVAMLAVLVAFTPTRSTVFVELSDMVITRLEPSRAALFR